MAEPFGGVTVPDVYLADVVTETLERLDDSPDKLWTRDEIELYVRDGYDRFCDETLCLFDMFVIENRPPIGTHGSDFQKALAEKMVGVRVTENKLNVTNDDAYQYGTGDGRDVTESYDQPVTVDSRKNSERVP